MKRKYIYTTAIVILTILFYLIEHDFFVEKKEISRNLPKTLPEANEINTFYLPTSTTGAIVHHHYYSLSYNENHEQSEWVAYELKKSHLSYENRKRPYFEEDPLVTSRSASWRNYKKSGYDRGHLCPAGDRRFSLEAYNETFFTSNVTPQEHNFNSGIWNRLEQKVRDWAKRYDGVYVVTGGILNNDLDAIGTENVSVPNYFYKIVLDRQGKEYKLIAFLIPHQESNKNLASFVVSVDSIEALTKIDFFPNLPDKIENIAEATKNTEKWKF